MKTFTRLVLILYLLSTNSFSAAGQRLSFAWQHRSNFSWNLGYSAWDERLPEGYNYSPITFLGQYRFTQIGPFHLYAESQIARVAGAQTRDFDKEFGLNLGLTYQLAIIPALVMAASVGSGPYYITVDTRRQARGFIFSDNFELGFSFHPMRSNTAVNLRGRFRHISNAGLEDPNGGIDNFFVVLGLSHLF